MRKLHLSLQEQLDHFDMKQEQIAEAIIEVQKRIKILDEVMSWTLPEQGSGRELGQEEFPLAELPLEHESHDADDEGPEIEWIDR